MKGREKTNTTDEADNCEAFILRLVDIVLCLGESVRRKMFFPIEYKLNSKPEDLHLTMDSKLYSLLWSIFSRRDYNSTNEFPCSFSSVLYLLYHEGMMRGKRSDRKSLACRGLIST